MGFDWNSSGRLTSTRAGCIRGPRPTTITSISVYVRECVHIGIPYNGCCWEIIWQHRVQNNPLYSPAIISPVWLSFCRQTERWCHQRGHDCCVTCPLVTPWSFVSAVGIWGGMTKHLTSGGDEQRSSLIKKCVRRHTSRKSMKLNLCLLFYWLGCSGSEAALCNSCPALIIQKKTCWRFPAFKHFELQRTQGIHPFLHFLFLWF